MKKILLIAIMAIFTTGAFAATNVKISKSVSKSIKKEKETPKKQKALLDFNTCEQKASFSIDCGGGRIVLMGVFTLSYDCETGKTTNQDFYSTGRTCDSPQEMMW